jgi:S1-C subfamily serine protease
MRRLAWIAVVIGASGCGAAAAPAPVSPEAPAASATAAPVASAPLPAHTLPRSAVHAIVAGGLGAFLQRVDLDDHPVFDSGKFHGFRIAALHGPAFWNGVDLKPGDVVTAVNGFPIERPEQAQDAFESLDVASELRVAYERDGKPRELVYAIASDR